MKEEIYLFYNGPLNNWYRSNFNIDNVKFSSAEQYLMYEKAKLFNDKESMNLIINTLDPKEQKTLGRAVKNFNDSIWVTKAKEIMFKGLYGKFSQNEFLKKFLLDTGDKVIAEASPFDRRWGIGLSIYNKDALDRSKWRGDNWLGFALMDVRKKLQDQQNKK